MDLTENQKNAAVGFTILIGCLIALLAILTNYWFLHSLPPTPDLTTGNGRTSDMVKQDIDNYKNIVAILKDNQSFLNDLLIAKFLKGLFDSLLVAVIAYVFGKTVVLAIAARLKGKMQN